MPPLTPQITLNINLLDFSGAQIGAVGAPAYVRIGLAGYGQYTPEVSGAGIIAKVASAAGDLPYVGSMISVQLWGNDVIQPANTFYVITVLDSNRNVIQCVPYQFSGNGTFDLSTVTPYNFIAPPTPIAPTVAGALVTVPYALNPTFDCSLVTAGIITFEITLTGNVTASTLINAQPGQIVILSVIQDGTGGRTFTFPSNVRNTTIIDADPSSITVQAFYARANGNLYPIGAGTYN